MKRPLIILLFFAGWLAAVLLVGGLMGLGAELVGMSGRTYHNVLGAIIAISVIVWLWKRGYRWYKYRQDLKWLEQHLDAHPQYAEDIPEDVLDALDQHRRR